MGKERFQRKLNYVFEEIKNKKGEKYFHKIKFMFHDENYEKILFNENNEFYNFFYGLKKPYMRFIKLIFISKKHGTVMIDTAMNKTKILYMKTFNLNIIDKLKLINFLEGR